MAGPPLIGGHFFTGRRAQEWEHPSLWLVERTVSHESARHKGTYMANIADIEGIGPAYAEKLSGAGIGTLEALLEKGKTPRGREELETATGISGTLLLKWVNRADLDRVKGVGAQYADLLEHAGVDSVPELAQRNAANLAAKMAEVNEAKNLVNRAPSESEVQGWIDHAKELGRVVEY